MACLFFLASNSRDLHVPWTPADAKRHKKGLSPKQARQWAHIANAALAACLARGGSQSSCEGSAVRQANGAVGTPARATQARMLSVETALTVQPARLTLQNREYVTAPGVLLVAGVLNQALVHDDVLEADAWNGVPVVIGHPRDAQGTPVSARDPTVFAAHGVGTVYRARLGTGTRGSQVVRSLQAELWLDCGLVEALGGEALQALTMLEAQQPLELSTGFYATAIPQAGSFYGTPYTEMLTDLVPDHLALLPNDVGACSWTNGGCGAPRLHQQGCDATAPCAACRTERSAMAVSASPQTRWQAFVALLRQFVHQEDTAESAPDPPEEGREVPEEDQEVPSAQEAALTTTQLMAQQTDADIREALYAALAREVGTNYTPTFIDSIDSATQAFVYRQGERLMLRRWTVAGDGIVTLDATTQDVQRDTRFVPVPDTEMDAEPPDSHLDLPHAFAAQAQCPSCLAALTSDPTGRLAAPCASCSAPAPTGAVILQERTPMAPVPVVSPVAIKARVNNLIANQQYGWSERDRPMLETMSEAFLIRLESQPIIMPAPAPPPPAEPPKTPQEAIATLPEHLQDMFVQMHREYQERRQAALAILLAHQGCPFEQDELQTFSVERLEKLVHMGAGVEYSGKGLPAPKPLPEVFEAPPLAPKTMDLVIERQKAQGLR